jgi:hypothetical protein
MTTLCRRVSIVVPAALLLAGMMPIAALGQQNEAAAPAASASTCTPTTLRYITSTTPISTRSTTPVNVRESTLTFVQGGTQASCVIVSFSAVSAVAQFEVMSVQAVLDNQICNPGISAFQSTPVFTARSMTFVCIVVQPGKHTVKMQFRSANRDPVFLDRRTLIVQYVK